MMRRPVHWVADLDLAQFFDTMPHQEILSVLALRIKDRKFLRLIARMLRAGVQTPGGVMVDELGSPQGSIVSPVIVNIFLDHVLDQWFSQVVCHHCRGYCSLIRYADDTVVLFERECHYDWRNSDSRSIKLKPNCCALANNQLGRHSKEAHS
jgi:retron-type reverse transcriptase